jgi:hypothetical protein
MSHNTLINVSSPSVIFMYFRSFEYELANYSPYYIRPPCGNVRAHMLSCIHGPLMGSETRLVHQVKCLSLYVGYLDLPIICATTSG